MAMIRKESAGDYQIGIYRVTRLLSPIRKSQPMWEVEDRDGKTLHWCHTLADAYKLLTGEDLRQKRGRG